MSPLVQVLIVGVGTYTLRASLITLLGRIEPSPRVREALSLVAPATLAGLVAQTLLLEEGAVRGVGAWHVAALVAAAVGWWRRSVGLTLACGMVCLWIVSSVA